MNTNEDKESSAFFLLICLSAVLVSTIVIFGMQLKAEESKARICFDYAERGQKIVVFKDKNNGFHCDLLKENKNEM